MDDWCMLHTSCKIWTLSQLFVLSEREICKFSQLVHSNNDSLKPRRNFCEKTCNRCKRKGVHEGHILDCFGILDCNRIIQRNRQEPGFARYNRFFVCFTSSLLNPQNLCVFGFRRLRNFGVDKIWSWVFFHDLPPFIVYKQPWLGLQTIL